MKRRDVLKLAGGGILAGVSAMPRFAFAASQPSMVVIHKISGIPWVNLMKSGVEKAGKDFGINATLIGPTAADPAQQAKLIEDVIAQKVDVLGLVPLDVNVCAPLLARAARSGRGRRPAGPRRQDRREPRPRAAARRAEKEAPA